MSSNQKPITEVAKGTTKDSIPKAIFDFKTTNNTNYLIDIKVSAKNIGGEGGAIFYQTLRVLNDSNKLTISSPLANGTNSTNGTLSNANIYLSANNSRIFLNVTGLDNQTINWLALIQLIPAN
jgi:hypothetical protein